MQSFIEKHADINCNKNMQILIVLQKIYTINFFYLQNN